MTTASIATMTPTEERLALLKNGYSQLVAVEGKIPKGMEWQLHQTTSDTVDLWEKVYPNARSTGIVCGNVIGIDVDLLHADAADAVEELIRDRFSDARILVRYGRRPKRLFMFRTIEPFSGFKATLYAPKGAGLEVRDGLRAGGPRLEVLGRGSQFVALGLHEDTGQPYTWPDGSPLDVRFEDLPEISEATIRELMQ